MNSLQGKITSIENQGNLSLVTIKAGPITLKSIVIETPASAGYLKEGKEINILFKETEVIIGKENDAQISLQNRIPCTILNIKKGALLSKLSLKYEEYLIGSVITSRAVEQLNLSEGDKVVAFIKTNEVMLSQ